MSGGPVTLVPFRADLLAAVQPWFEHPEVRRRLGGPEWPARELAITEQKLGEIFRGRRVLRVHSWVALDAAGVPVAKIGGDVYDRWCRYREDPGGSVVDRVEPGPAMGLAYVVDPRRWRQGFGRATLRAVVDAPEVADVILFGAGVDHDNVASARCATSAGFVADGAEPDWESTVYHVLRRRPPR
ncbi:MAG TPA: GNAT family N-acetyltransferase [Actinoplanes sp.]